MRRVEEHWEGNLDDGVHAVPILLTIGRMADTTSWQVHVERRTPKPLEKEKIE